MNVKRLNADFNAQDAEGLLATLRKRAPDVVVGERVELYESDEDRCEGVVEKLTDSLIYSRPDWNTW